MWQCTNIAPALISRSWGMRVGPEPGDVVKAVGVNSEWIAIELNRHRLKYLPLRHPRDNSALFQLVDKDGTPITQSPSSLASSADSSAYVNERNSAMKPRRLSKRAAHPMTDPPTCPLVYSLTHPLTYLLTNVTTQPPTRSLLAADLTWMLISGNCAPICGERATSARRGSG